MDLRQRVEHLHRTREPFVLATVVRAQRPTSAKPGDRAVMLADGTLEGFIGGTCAESTVRLQGLTLLETGMSVLLRIMPQAGPQLAEEEGLVTVNNPCHSGGTLEIFLEAMLPAPLIHVFGDSPVAKALTRIAAAAGYELAEGVSAGATHAGYGNAEAPAAKTPVASAAAVVVASHGRDEEPVLRAAVEANVPYIALVASRRRGDAVLEELGLDRDRVHTPAGLDIGARTAPEVAISILAEIISSKPRAAKAALATATDPICGMQVAITPSALRSGDHYFCGPGCLTAFIGT